MIPLSSRLALPALVILLMAAIPIWTLSGNRSSDCRDPEALTTAIPDRDEAITYMTGAIIQSFSPYELYGRPRSQDFAANYPDDTVVMRDVRVDGITLPVHWSAATTPGEVWVRAYYYVHAGEPVPHPFRSGLALAPRQLIEGTLPVTVVVVDGSSDMLKGHLVEPAVEDWIRKSWRHYKASCLP